MITNPVLTKRLAEETVEKYQRILKDNNFIGALSSVGIKTTCPFCREHYDWRTLDPEVSCGTCYLAKGKYIGCINRKSLTNLTTAIRNSKKYTESRLRRLVNNRISFHKSLIKRCNKLL